MKRQPGEHAGGDRVRARRGPVVPLAVAHDQRLVAGGGGEEAALLRREVGDTRSASLIARSGSARRRPPRTSRQALGRGRRSPRARRRGGALPAAGGAEQSAIRAHAASRRRIGGGPAASRSPSSPNTRRALGHGPDHQAVPGGEDLVVCPGATAPGAPRTFARAAATSGAARRAHPEPRRHRGPERLMLGSFSPPSSRARRRRSTH